LGPFSDSRAVDCEELGRMLELLRSSRHGLRRTARQPGVSLAVVLPVALALAVITALFSIVDGLL